MATSLYEHKESRDHLLALAQQNPKDHWADAGEVIGSIESRMAFDKAFAE